MPRQMLPPLLRAGIYLLGMFLFLGCSPKIGVDNLASSEAFAGEEGKFIPLYGPAYKNSAASLRSPNSRPRNIKSISTERRRRNAKYRGSYGFKRRASYASGRIQLPYSTPKKQLRGPSYKNRTAKSH